MLAVVFALAGADVTECPAGKLVLADACEPCETGKYQDSAGNQTTCKLCEKGRYSNEAGKSSCKRCVEGHVANNLGSTICHLCNRTEAVNMERTGCVIECPKGSYESTVTGTDILECKPCEAGQFLEYEGAKNPGECRNCPRGHFGEAPGAGRCTPCPAGQFQNLLASLSCSPCKAGRFAESGRSKCILCPDGKFSSAVMGACAAECEAGKFVQERACHQCPLGQASSRSSLSPSPSTCALRCHSGTYQRTNTQKCELCPIGKYSDNSTDFEHYTDSNSTSYEKVFCQACPAGRFGAVTGLSGPQCSGICATGFFCPAGSDVKNQMLCPLDANGEQQTSVPGATSADDCYAGRRCSAGKYMNETIFFETASHDLACLPCPPGRHKDRKSDDTTCQACDIGTFTPVDGLNASSCPRCEPGKYNELPGKEKCNDCQVGKFLQTDGATSVDECMPCMAHSLTLHPGSVSPDDCICAVDHYLSTDTHHGLGRQCRRCPRVGVDCLAQGSTLEGLIVLPGYWRAALNSTNMHKCSHEQACIGSTEGVAAVARLQGVNLSALGANIVCSRGHTGPLCSVCAEGYAMLTGKMCEECGDSKSMVPMLSSLGAAALFFVVCYSAWIQYRKHKKHIMRKDQGEEKEESSQRAHVLYRLLVNKGKIVVSFFQVVCSFGSVFSVPYPEKFSLFLSFMDVFNLAFMKFFATGCLIDRNFFTDLIIITGLPILIIIGIFVGYKRSVKGESDEHARHHIRKRFANYFLGLLYFIYSGVTSAIFQVFQTRRYEDGKAYVVVDMSIVTDSTSYTTMYLYAMLMIVVFPIGIVFVNFWVLWTNKHFIWNRRDLLCRACPSLCRRFHSHLNDADPRLVQEDVHEIMDSLDFLVGSYKEQYWWFEVFELLRKLVLTGVFSLVLPDSDTQLTMGTLVCMLSFWVYTDCKPYRVSSDNTLAICAQFGNFMVLYAGLLIKMRLMYRTQVVLGFERDPNNVQEFWIEWILIVLCGSFPVLALVLIARDIRYPPVIESHSRKDTENIERSRKHKVEMYDDSNPDRILDFKRLFDHYDEENLGFVDSDFIERVAIAMGHSEQDASAMISHVDPDDTGKIYFESFCYLMTGQKNVRLEDVVEHARTDAAVASTEEIFEAFVLSDPSEELSEELQLLLDEAGLHFMYQKDGRDVYSTWQWDDIKKVRGQKQGNKIEEMEILNLQINSVIFSFEVDDSKKITDLINYHRKALQQDGQESSTFEIFLYEDPTNLLPDEMKVEFSKFGIRVFDLATEEQNSVFTWNTIRSIKRLPPSDDPDELDLIEMKVENKGLFCFEVEEWEPIEKAYLTYRAPTKVLL